MNDRLLSLLVAVPTLMLAACSSTSPVTMEDGTLRFLAPEVNSAGNVVSSELSPAAVAEAFRSAGYNRVSIGQSGKTVRVRSPQPDMIECGEIVQQVGGVQARFNGNARRAAILAASGETENDLLLRDLTATSEIVLTQMNEGQYQVREDHSVTLEYRWAVSGKGSKETAKFDADSVASFADKTQCVSASIAQKVL